MDTGIALVDRLLNFSDRLCAALPTRFCCNEPSYCCFDKPPELQLAVGKCSKCSGCGTARYCGTADQHKHWKQHKPVCNAVAAAAKAAAALVQPSAPAAVGVDQGLSKGKKKGKKQH
jgi:hypothetical protein